MANKLQAMPTAADRRFYSDQASERAMARDQLKGAASPKGELATAGPSGSRRGCGATSRRSNSVRRRKRPVGPAIREARAQG
jgi:hypothetical protein